MRFNIAGLGGLLVAATFGLTACSAGSAQPDQPTAPHVFIGSVMPYQDAEVGSAAVQADCDWNRELPAKLAEQTDGVVIVDDVAFRNPSVRRLVLTVVNVHSIGGAAITGPKWAVVRGLLIDGGRLVGSFEFGDTSIHGRFTACGTLSNLGENIAGKIADWLKAPTLDPNVPSAVASAAPPSMAMRAATNPAATASGPVIVPAPVTALASGRWVVLSAAHALRRQPKEDAPLGDALPAGTSVYLDSKLGDFWFIKTASSAGWLRTNELQNPP